jgi:hypothetical protein
MKSSIHILIVAIATLFFASCAKKADFVGPELKAASPSFRVIDTFSVHKTSANDSIFLVKTEGSTALINSNYFAVKFSESVSWTITLNGPVATKKIMGVSSFIDSTNSVWKGESDGIFQFSDGDLVIATLNFAGTDLALKDTFLLTKPKYSSAFLAKPFRTSDTLNYIYVNDFEGPYAAPITYNDNKDPIAGPAPTLVSTSANLRFPEGSKAMGMYGTDNNGDYFIGGFKLPAQDTVNRLGYDKVLAKHAPSDIYVNMYVYGYPVSNEKGVNTAATKLNIGVSEDDKKRNAAFEADSEDTFEQQISINWVGWKLISVRYSNMIRSSVAAEGGNGNAIQEPDKIFSINFSLISSPQGSTVGTIVDHVVLSFGKPLGQ